MPNQLEKISMGLQSMGPALGGLSAGLQGRLPEYQAYQEQQKAYQAQSQQAQQEMAEGRMKAMYQDANAMRSLAEQGNYDAVARLGMERLMYLQQFGDADPEDTQVITQLAIAAKNGSEEAQEHLMNELDTAVDIGRARGYIEQPEMDNAVTDLGKLKQDLDAGYITQEQFDQLSENGALRIGKNVQRSVEVPGQGFNKVYEDGTTEFTPYSVEQAQAYAASQKQALDQAGAMASVEATAASEAQARQAIKNTINEGAFAAMESMPRLNRMMELAKIAETGAFAEQKTAAKRIFGMDVADEEEFMALTNQEILAAADALKGALSEKENAYLEAVAPNIGKSREGNQRIIQNLITIAGNAIARREAFNNFEGDPSDFYFQGAEWNDSYGTGELEVGDYKVEVID